jgi:leucyl-tRNA synthetase
VIEVPLDAGHAEVEEQAIARPKIQQYLNGKQMVKVIYVPGKILNTGLTQLNEKRPKIWVFGGRG